MNFLLVACGGFFGSILRSYLSILCQKRFIGTWVANISGSLLLAVTVRLYVNGTFSEGLWLLVGVGFCGAYTTFSTFSYEAIQLMIEKQFIQASVYIFSTLSISILLVGLVIAL